METGEQLVRLDQEETALLQRMSPSGSRAGYFLIAAATVALVAHIVYRALMLRSHGGGFGFFGPTMIEWVVLLLLLLVGLYALTRGGRDKRLAKNIELDLKEGYKKVVARRVESQRIEGHEPVYFTTSGRVASRRSGHLVMSYLLKIDGDDYSASEELYMKVRPGDTIDFHVAPNSGVVLYYKVASDDKYFPPAALARV
jgi:hypothetical protein